MGDIRMKFGAHRAVALLVTQIAVLIESTPTVIAIPGTEVVFIPATPAMIISFGFAADAATPRIRLAVETIPSFAPSTAARSQPMRAMR